MTSGFALIQRFVHETSGFVIDDDKLYLIEHRLRPILQEAKLSSLDDLARCLQGNSHSELARLVAETLTINETSFFRDKSLFSAFADDLLPALIEARRDRRRLRIWCAACSTGQEPYSLAMLIDENARSLAGWHVEIMATDLSRSVVETARCGSYSQFEVQRGLPVAMLLRNFRRDGDNWRISDYLRAKVVFREQNLMTSFRDLGTFDIIFCRNVLIYFDVATKRRLLGNLEGALADDGYLVLGAAESVSGLSDSLRPNCAKNFVFAKNKPAENGSASRSSALAATIR